MTDQKRINCIARDLLERLDDGYYNYTTNCTMYAYADYRISLTDAYYLSKLFGNRNHVDVNRLCSDVLFLVGLHTDVSKKKLVRKTAQTMKQVIKYGQLSDIQVEAAVTSIKL